jgi:hypothetical protein
MTPTTLDILTNARNMLETLGWTKGALARDHEGDVVDPTSDMVCSVCAYGALGRAAGWNDSNCATTMPRCVYLADHRLRQALDGGSYINKNDNPFTTKEDMIAVFNKAIRLEQEDLGIVASD